MLDKKQNILNFQMNNLFLMTLLHIWDILGKFQNTINIVISGNILVDRSFPLNRENKIVSLCFLSSQRELYGAVSSSRLRQSIRQTVMYVLSTF